LAGDGHPRWAEFLDAAGLRAGGRALRGGRGELSASQ
jgi:hypothetical protein